MDAHNIDPRTRSTAEFAGLLAPAIDNGIGAVDPRDSGNGSPAMMFVMGEARLDGDIGFAARLPTIFDMPTV